MVLRCSVLRPDLDRRKLPEPTQQTVGRTTDQKQLAVRIECHQQLVGDGAHARPALRGGSQFLGTLGQGPAFSRQRTHRAPRRSGSTHRGPQLHERLIPIPGPIGIDELAGSLPQARSRGVLEVEEAGQHAPHVSIHGGHYLAVDDARDGARGVLADPRKRPETLGVLREHPAEPLPHDQGRAPEIPGPRIIAEPLPCLEHGLFVSLRKIRHRGKALHPAEVVGNRRLDAGLLEHDLGDPDPVWLPALSPREVTPVGVVVLQEKLSEPGRVGGGSHCESQVRSPTLGRELGRGVGRTSEGLTVGNSVASPCSYPPSTLNCRVYFRVNARPRGPSS